MILSISFRNYLHGYQGVPTMCWYFIAFNLINALAVGVCFFLSIYFVDKLHLNMTIVGLLMSSYGLGTVIGGLLSGKLCDIFPPKLILILSILMQGLAFLTIGNLNSIFLLILTLLTLGISAYSFKTANCISMLSYCKTNSDQQLKAINISHAAANFGLGISGAAISLLVEFGYSIIFYCAGVILLASSLFLFFIKTSATTDNKDSTNIETTKKITHKSNKIFLLTLVSLFLVGLIIAQLGATYPIYVKETFPQMGIQAVSILFILDTILIVTFQAPLSNYYAKYNTLIVMGLGAALMGIGMLILSFATDFSVAIISCIIWTTGEMMFLPTAQLLCYKNSSHEKKGLSIGIFQSTYAISTVAGPLLGGYLYNTVSPNIMWYLSFIIGICCLTACLKINKTVEAIL